MKKTIWILTAIVGCVILWGTLTYNSIIREEEQLWQSWSQVENVYQRRLELVPNLVDVVSSYSDYEERTLVNVVTERAKAVSTTVITSGTQNEEQLLRFDEAQQLLSDAVDDILVSVENYPDLKAIDAYQTFLAQYEGCENRILIERRRYNQSVNLYNQKIRKFPNNLIANIFNFKPQPSGHSL